MSISSNYLRRHFVAASCATMGAAVTAYASQKEETSNTFKNHHLSVSVSPSASSAMTAASNDASFWVATLLQDPFVRTTLAEPSDFRGKKKLTKGMTLEEKWEYFAFMAINPGEDDDDDDDDDDVSTSFVLLVASVATR